MLRCPNIIENFNVRKFWKYIRTKHLNSDKQRKLDSDTILLEMRTKTDMTAVAAVTKSKMSLEYERNGCGDYKVAYNPMILERAIQYTTDSKLNRQKGFEYLSVHTENSRCDEVDIVTRKRYKTG
tara:strand:+ start:9442 stop:9816 length:375 start_codon:yes stop_codon:yes gene_type:complete